MAKAKTTLAWWRWLVVAAIGLSLQLLLLVPDGDGPSYVVIVTGLAITAVGLVRAWVEHRARP